VAAVLRGMIGRQPEIERLGRELTIATRFTGGRSYRARSPKWATSAPTPSGGPRVTFPGISMTWFGSTSDTSASSSPMQSATAFRPPC
jgi:hypothetical protein